jgi:hypothetical protein
MNNFKKIKFSFWITLGYYAVAWIYYHFLFVYDIDFDVIWGYLQLVVSFPAFLSYFIQFTSGDSMAIVVAILFFIFFWILMYLLLLYRLRR